MTAIRFDHIAIGMSRIADATEMLVGTLGGVPAHGEPSGVFRWHVWTFEGGGAVEILEPMGDHGFLHRFLAERGPGVHHVTFKVPSLDEVCARAERAGYDVVGRDDRDPELEGGIPSPEAGARHRRAVRRVRRRRRPGSGPGAACGAARSARARGHRRAAPARPLPGARAPAMGDGAGGPGERWSRRRADLPLARLPDAPRRRDRSRARRGARRHRGRDRRARSRCPTARIRRWAPSSGASGPFPSEGGDGRHRPFSAGPRRAGRGRARPASAPSARRPRGRAWPRDRRRRCRAARSGTPSA